MGGRKKFSKVWRYFEYNEETGKSMCLYVDENSNTTCGNLLIGKNTTNLISHLRRLHKVNIEQFKIKGEGAKDLREGNVLKKENNIHKVLYKNKYHTTINNIKVENDSDNSNIGVNSQNVVDFVVETGSPVTIVDMPSFKKMLVNLQPTFIPPCSMNVKKTIENIFIEKQKLIKLKLDRARRVCICIDARSIEETHETFIGISACFFDNSTKKSVHVTLNLKEIIDLQTGENIGNIIEQCLQEWDIPQQKVLQIISDNGLNILKGTKDLQMQNQFPDDDLGMENEDNEEEDDEVNNKNQLPELKNQEGGHFDFLQLTPFYHLPCLANTIYHLIRPVFLYYNSILTKAWQLVDWIRKSEIMKELLFIQCSQMVISKCISRWNSTYMMVKSLISIKMDIQHVMENQGIEFLSASEWSCLDEIYIFLEPFVSQTELLQKDSMSLSFVLPSILNLECHLQQATAPRDLCDQLLHDLRKLFSSILEPTTLGFNPLPAAACLLDPSVRDFILTPELDNLLQEAKGYVSAMNPKTEGSAELEDVHCGNSSARDQFKFLATKIKVNANKSSATSLSKQLTYYMCDGENNENDVLQYWIQKESVYPVLSQIAQDLVSVPASQTFIKQFERNFMNMTQDRKKKSQFSEIQALLQMNNNMD